MSSSSATDEAAQHHRTANSKRARSSAEEGSGSLHEKLIEFSKRVVEVKKKISEFQGGEEEADLHDDIRKSLWFLILEVEPFLFLCLDDLHPFSHFQIVQTFKTGKKSKDVKHALLAFRIFVAVLQLSAFDVALTVHGLCTMLCCMPHFANPDPLHSANTTRYIDAILSSINSLLLSNKEIGLAFVQSMLSSDAVSHLILSGSTHTRTNHGCWEFEFKMSEFIDHAVPDAVLGRGSLSADERILLKKLFRTAFVTSTQYEVAKIIYGYCLLFSELFSSTKYPFSAAVLRNLTFMTCSVLTVPFGIYEVDEPTSSSKREPGSDDWKRLKQCDFLSLSHHQTVVHKSLFAAAGNLLKLSLAKSVASKSEDLELVASMQRSVLEYWIADFSRIPLHNCWSIELFQSLFPITDLSLEKNRGNWCYDKSIVTLLVKVLLLWSGKLFVNPSFSSKNSAAVVFNTKKERVEAIDSFSIVLRSVEALRESSKSFGTFLDSELFLIQSFLVKKELADVFSFSLPYYWHLRHSQDYFFVERLFACFNLESVQAFFEEALIVKKEKETACSFQFMAALALSSLKYHYTRTSTALSDLEKGKHLKAALANLQQLMEEVLGMLENHQAPHLKVLMNTLIVTFHSHRDLGKENKMEKLLDFMINLRGFSNLFLSDENVPEESWALLFCEIGFCMPIQEKANVLKEIVEFHNVLKGNPIIYEYALMGLLEADALWLKKKLKPTYQFELQLLESFLSVLHSDSSFPTEHREKTLSSFVTFMLAFITNVFSRAYQESPSATEGTGTPVTTVVDVDDEEAVTEFVEPRKLSKDIHRLLSLIFQDALKIIRDIPLHVTDTKNEDGMPASNENDFLLLQLVCCIVVLDPEVVGDSTDFARSVSTSSHNLIRCGLGPAAVYSLLCFQLNEVYSEDGNTKRAMESVLTLQQFLIDADFAKAHDGKTKFIDLRQLGFIKYLLTFTWFSALEPAHIEALQLITKQCTKRILSAYMKWHREQCSAVMHLCFSLEQEEEMHFPLVDFICDLLRSLGWSSEDLCRRYPEVTPSSIFKKVCLADGVMKYEDVVSKSLDALVGEMAFPATTAIGINPSSKRDLKNLNLTALTSFLESAFVDVSLGANAIVPPFVAFVLYTPLSFNDKAEGLETMCAQKGVSLNDIPSLVKSMLASIVLNILSLNADAQLSSVEKRETNFAHINKLSSDSVAFGVLSAALCQCVSLAEAAPTKEGVLTVLRAPVSQNVAGVVLVKVLFDIIDSISRMLCGRRSTVDSLGDALDSLPSETSMKRWLLSLADFLNFMGEHSTLIAAKLPASLDTCLRRIGTLPYVILVWHDLLLHCSIDYMRQHAASLVVDIIELEQVSEDNAQDDDKPFVNQSLLTVMQFIYQQTRQDAFWSSYFVVLAPSSKLIASLKQQSELHSQKTPTRKSRIRTRSSLQAANSVNSQKVVTTDLPEDVTAVVEGFLLVMRSSSLKCKVLFVQSFYRYMKTLSPLNRLNLTEAAKLCPTLVPVLLQCTREFQTRNAKLVVLQAIGLLGAISPLYLMTNKDMENTSFSTDDAIASTDKEKKESASVGLLSLSDMPYEGGVFQRHHYLDVRKVLEWREWAITLLRVYCVRALTNTADNEMHDRAAYAIQELIRIFTKKERKTSRGTELRDDEILHVDELLRYYWWRDLPENIQKLLEGFLSTKYKTLIYQYTERRTPEYRRKMTYETWLINLFKNLSSRCVGTFGDEMMALRNVAKRDTELAMFLLPYVVVHLLECGDDNSWDALLTEFDAIFQVAVSTAKSAGQKTEKELHSPTQLSIRSSNVAESSQTVSHLVDEHVQLLVNILEDINQLRWRMLSIKYKVERYSGNFDGNEELCEQRAARYKEFLEAVSWTNRTLSCIEIGSNMRALRSIESVRYLPSPYSVIESIPLQRIFASLNDQDSSKAVHRISQNLNPEKAAFSYENNGEWLLAMQNCELVLQHSPHSIPHQLTALRCMRQMGQLHLMSRYSQSLLECAEPRYRTPIPVEVPGNHAVLTVPSQVSEEDLKNKNAWNRSKRDRVTRGLTSDEKTIMWYANEAAWRLNEWDRINSEESLPFSLANPIMKWVNFWEKERVSLPAIHDSISTQRWSIILSLHSNYREGYVQGYNFVVLSHALSDLEITCEMLCKSATKGPDRDSTEQLVKVLNRRMEATEESLEGRETLLALHRSIYNSLGLKKEVAQTWLKYAVLLRDGGFYDAAWNAIQQINICHIGDVDVSYYSLAAELLYEMKNPRSAMEFALRHIEDTNLQASTRSKLKVLLTKWTSEIGSKTPTEVIDSYNAALAIATSEDAHHNLALFYDNLYMFSKGAMLGKWTAGIDKAVERQQVAEAIRLIDIYALQAIEHYGKALSLGISTVSVSLSRMLTVWFDSTEDLKHFSVKTNYAVVEADTILRRMNKLVEMYLLGTASQRALPTSVAVTALSQLLSRLGHPSEDVVALVAKVVVNLMLHYPQPCLWMVLPIALGKQANRAKVVKLQIIQVFKDQCQKDSSHQGKSRALEDAFNIFTALIEFCNAPASNFTSSGKINKFPPIQRIEPKLPAAEFILPTLSNLTPSLSALDMDEKTFSVTSTFHHFDEHVVIMNSLQKPKRIGIVTNEGATIYFLCKAKDEPRKDITMMEIAALMNTCFLTDPDTYKRDFSLRRYAIAALSDDCAMIEWVTNLQALRSSVNDCYALDRTGARISDIKKWLNKVETKEIKMLEMFKNYIMPAFPPVLHQWFDRIFKSNQEWFDARTLFTKSSALWSVAGHIVGLGDRHGENLMLDQRTGELMHVDFACMFDKGESLEVPERVRFRLTQNMTDAMGILGADGPFRTNCEIALRCQVRNKNAVMSIVEVLLHDPLVEWISRGSSRSPAIDPKQLINRVKRRLGGYLDLYSNPPQKDAVALNIEGQVSKLISHSSALENLSEMYIWWMAWI